MTNTSIPLAVATI